MAHAFNSVIMWTLPYFIADEVSMSIYIGVVLALAFLVYGSLPILISIVTKIFCSLTRKTVTKIVQ
jgi:hypothetical protein